MGHSLILFQLKTACKEVGQSYTKPATRCKTRWNSTRTNLVSVLKLRRPLDTLFADDSEAWMEKRLTSSEWKLVKGAIEVKLLFLN